MYDPQTRSQLQTGQLFPAKNNKRHNLDINKDGSVGLYFGPKAPKGHEANWIQTVPGKGWFACLRPYGPLEPWFDKSWRPGEIELMDEPGASASATPTEPVRVTPNNYVRAESDFQMKGYIEKLGCFGKLHHSRKRAIHSTLNLLFAHPKLREVRDTVTSGQSRLVVRKRCRRSGLCGSSRRLL